jgi:hypothetical protein
MKCPSCRSENSETVKFCGECGTPLPWPAKPQPSGATETIQTPIHELTTGATFAGRYQVIEELGKGGMGRVYKAFDAEIKEKIALKLLKPEIGIALKHKTEDPKNQKDFNPQIPEDLSRLILKCLEKKPEIRYDSVQEMTCELDIILAGILHRGMKAPTVTRSSAAEHDQRSSKRSWDLDHAAIKKNLAKIIANSQLSIKDDITHVTFSRTDRIVAAINEITKNIAWDPDQVFFINQGGGEITLILDREKRSLFLNILPQAIEIREKAAVIRIRESKAEDIVPGIEVPGLFAYFIDQVSGVRVNILDIISTRSTLTLVIAEEDLMRAYSALSECIQHLRKMDG